MNGVSMDGVVVSLGALPSLTELKVIWQELERRADHSFFQSWYWIGVWLELLPPQVAPKLLRIERNGTLIGLGLLSQRDLKRHVMLRSRALFLNNSGDPEIDEITIEHNGLLAETGSGVLAAQALVDFLRNNFQEWDELYLDGLRKPDELGAVKLGAMNMRMASRRSCHYVNLDELRTAGGDYIARLGKNTRYVIRRSMRAYEKLGAFQTDAASTLEQAREYMDRLRVLHQQYWQQKGLPGSFANEFFAKFHNRLLEHGFGEGAVQMLRLSVGGHEIGYLYNFVYRGRVYNYQSGFDYGLVGSHGRPGLVCHAMAVEHNVRLGNRIYDFMAGDSDYKKNLGTHLDEMAWVVIQQPRVILRLENALREFKRMLKSRSEGKVSTSDTGSNNPEGAA